MIGPAPLVRRLETWALVQNFVDILPPLHIDFAYLSKHIDAMI